MATRRSTIDGTMDRISSDTETEEFWNYASAYMQTKFSNDTHSVTRALFSMLVMDF